MNTNYRFINVEQSYTATNLRPIETEILFWIVLLSLPKQGNPKKIVVDSGTNDDKRTTAGVLEKLVVIKKYYLKLTT